MELNIVNAVAVLQRLSVGQLRQRFAEIFIESAPYSHFDGYVIYHAVRRGGPARRDA